MIATAARSMKTEKIKKKKNVITESTKNILFISCTSNFAVKLSFNSCYFINKSCCVR